MSTGSTVIDYTNGAVSSGKPMLEPVHDTKGNIVAMPQVPGDLCLLPVSADVQRGMAVRCSMVQKSVQVVLKDSESEKYSGAESEQALMKRVAT